MENPQIKRAVISVTDKTGIVDFARALQDDFGVEIVSTGGTARVLDEGGVKVRPIDDLTEFPEMMDGRVKTLHPAVHGGLLARRDNPEHMAQASQHGIGMIDMVVVNLYAFEATIAKPESTFADCIENIDIGGPSMLRSAAKNHEFVTVVTRPQDYDGILEEMRSNDGATTLATRRRLALQVFEKTSAYDNAIYTWMREQVEGQDDLPASKRVIAQKVADLRYGENPRQKAAFYVQSSDGASLPEGYRPEHTLGQAEQLQGKELSYNNYLDLDAAWSAVREFDEPACVIVKHLNPCGIATDENIVVAYMRAHECDPVSAFGGVMAFNREVQGTLVQAIIDNKQFIEAVIAPGYSDEALHLFETKHNARVLRTGGMNKPGLGTEVRSVEGGLLFEQLDSVSEDPAGFTVPTKRKPTDAEMDELLFAWKTVRPVKSNAIVVTKGHATVGIGAGQPNRVNSARIAVTQAGEKANGAVASSDAFLPFPDTLEVLAAAGVTALIQPGGSVRDEEAIAIADEKGVAMVFAGSGARHFRH